MGNEINYELFLKDEMASKVRKCIFNSAVLGYEFGNIGVCRLRLRI